MSLFQCSHHSRRSFAKCPICNARKHPPSSKGTGVVIATFKYDEATGSLTLIKPS